MEPIGGTGPDACGAPYARVKLTGLAQLSRLLNHLYVLIPVLDDAKHYWVGEDEIDKLLKRGEGWLEQHPARELIVRRYLATAALWRARRSNGGAGSPRRGDRPGGADFTRRGAGGADPAER